MLVLSVAVLVGFLKFLHWVQLGEGWGADGHALHTGGRVCMQHGGEHLLGVGASGASREGCC